MLSPALIWFLVGVVFLASELFLLGFILVFFAAGSWIAAVFAWRAVADTEIERTQP